MSERVTSEEKAKKAVLRNLSFLHATNLLRAFGGNCTHPVLSGDSTVRVTTLETPFAKLSSNFSAYLATTINPESLSLEPDSYTVFGMTNESSVAPLLVVKKQNDGIILKSGNETLVKRSDLTSALNLFESMYISLASETSPSYIGVYPAPIPLTDLDPEFAAVMHDYFNVSD